MAGDGSLNESLGIDLRTLQAQLTQQEQKLSSFERRAKVFIANQKQTEDNFNRFESRITGRLKNIGKQVGKFALLQVATGLASELELPEGPAQTIASIGSAAAYGAMAGGPAGAVIAGLMAAVGQLIGAAKEQEKKWEDAAKRITALRKENEARRQVDLVKILDKLQDEADKREALARRIEEKSKEVAYDTWLMTGAD